MKRYGVPVLLRSRATVNVAADARRRRGALASIPVLRLAAGGGEGGA